MRKLPPLTELRAFEAAARHLSFKLAAAELGVTPTAISHQLKLLERHCGQSLFRRRPRPLALTRAGQQLFPVVRDGFETFAEALSGIRSGGTSGRLRLTATNAFTARWLVPRLPDWRDAYPRLKLDIIGTDTVLDLDSGEADIAVRYARKAPPGGPSVELLRDEFYVVASPRLVGNLKRPLSPAELARFPLIEAEWPPADLDAPRWQHWQRVASRRHRSAPDFAALPSLSFREELHAIEATVAGQGVAICSTVLIGPELANGTLVPVSRIKLPGYGFYIVHRAGHPKTDLITAFINWAQAAG
ncbi:LysR substrate-binding domain-containing protein [Bradyrhizobium sp. 2S1]|uniref:LysR substrate-binding domain-containing protein n=1 Tax=Bradyrhizobium sp. 2S1 TaxID=1404429 RepID=UPI001409D946|nr:LysR substrate-binding domain-containing protein [Bradyrhizobium sp. 2S1]MCK7669526.1 LysR substrate-binding domain-containing protein [Bradyrhizobium sp. 2S1]